MNNKPIRSAAAALALLMCLAGLWCVLGCFYVAETPQNSQQDGGLYTISPEDAAELDKTERPAETKEALATAQAAEPTEAVTEEPSPVPTAAPTSAPTAVPTAAPTECPVSEDGQYDTKDEVALYIYLYGHLPANYIKKSEAQALGWTGGSLELYAPGCSIGGDRFGNYEGLLPRKSGRYYTECDIGTKGRSSRGSKRIVFSNDGLIYYTGDHYESFTLLYGEENP